MALRLFPPSSPVLPLFESLLVKGPYPASAPLHLCLSQLTTAPTDRQSVLLITPSKETFSQSLLESGDHWLATHAQTGEYASLLHKVKIFYAPTAVHWGFLLSSFQLLGPSTNRTHDLVALKCAPSIIILHEPSKLFNDTGEENPEASQYLLIIMHAFSLASYFESLTPGQERIPVVVFGTEIDDLQMPLIRTSSPKHSFSFQSTSSDPPEDSRPKEQLVLPLVEKYFDVVCRVEKETLQPSQPTQANTPRANRMIFTKTRPRPDEKAIIWEWTETNALKRDDVLSTEYLWTRLG